MKWRVGKHGGAFCCAPRQDHGLAIGPSQFEVGPEVRAAFMAADIAVAAAFIPHGEKFLANIYLLARQRPAPATCWYFRLFSQFMAGIVTQ